MWKTACRNLANAVFETMGFVCWAGRDLSDQIMSVTSMYYKGSEYPEGLYITVYICDYTMRLIFRPKAAKIGVAPNVRYGMEPNPQMGNRSLRRFLESRTRQDGRGGRGRGRGRTGDKTSTIPQRLFGSDTATWQRRGSRQLGGLNPPQRLAGLILAFTANPIKVPP